eukprot:681676-Hanusia_phi.AAC.1
MLLGQSCIAILLERTNGLLLTLLLTLRALPSSPLSPLIFAFVGCDTSAAVAVLLKLCGDEDPAQARRRDEFALRKDGEGRGGKSDEMMQRAEGDERMEMGWGEGDERMEMGWGEGGDRSKLEGRDLEIDEDLCTYTPLPQSDVWPLCYR